MCNVCLTYDDNVSAMAGRECPGQTAYTRVGPFETSNVSESSHLVTTAPSVASTCDTARFPTNRAFGAAREDYPPPLSEKSAIVAFDSD